MHTILWTAQVLLALCFLAHGLLLLAPPARLRAEIEASPFPRAFLLLLGAAEVAAAIGLIVPALTGLAPVLVPLAAAGLVVVMAGAVVLHLRKAEPVRALVTLGIGLLAALVVIGRGVWLPF